MGNKTTSSASSESDLWTNSSTGEIAHSVSPRGGGGSGGFATPRALGADGNQTHRIPHPWSPAAKNVLPPYGEKPPDAGKRPKAQSAQPVETKIETKVETKKAA